MTLMVSASGKFQRMYGAWLPETPGWLGIWPLNELPVMLISSGVVDVGGLV